jgi:4'-phosphopantetheinyl transferase
MTKGTVHVWTVGLDAEPDRVSQLLASLSGEERVRAARLRTTELRLRFIVAHGAVRSILGSYLNVGPEQVTFEVTRLGKPSIAGSHLTFNLSHSDGLALCAVAQGGHLGIDVERIRPLLDADGIAKRYFAPKEASAYAACPETERSAVFFSTWTRKEAFLKATGLGLQRPLDSFEVDVTPTEPAPRLVVTRQPAPDEPRFFLRAFTPRPRYVAAIAFDRPIETIEFFDWTPEPATRPFRRVLPEMRTV